MWSLVQDDCVSAKTHNISDYRNWARGGHQITKLYVDFGNEFWSSGFEVITDATEMLVVKQQQK